MRAARSLRTGVDSTISGTVLWYVSKVLAKAVVFVDEDVERDASPLGVLEQLVELAVDGRRREEELAIGRQSRRCAHRPQARLRPGPTRRRKSRQAYCFPRASVDCRDSVLLPHDQRLLIDEVTAFEF